MWQYVLLCWLLSHYLIIDVKPLHMHTYTHIHTRTHTVAYVGKVIFVTELYAYLIYKEFSLYLRQLEYMFWFCDLEF